MIVIIIKMAQNKKQAQSQDNKQKLRDPQDREPAENVMDSIKQEFECNYLQI